MSTFSIRLATLDDCPAIALLCAQLAYPCATAEMQDRLCRVLPDTAHLLLVCPDAHGQVLGWIHAFERFTVESGADVEIAGLVVHSDARGRGVGRALLRAVESWAAPRDCSTLRLGCNVIRVDAHRFYERAGFELVKSQKIFRKTLRVAPASAER